VDQAALCFWLWQSEAERALFGTWRTTLTANEFTAGDLRSLWEYADPTVIEQLTTEAPALLRYFYQVRAVREKAVSLLQQICDEQSTDLLYLIHSVKQEVESEYGFRLEVQRLLDKVMGVETPAIDEPAGSLGIDKAKEHLAKSRVGTLPSIADMVAPSLAEFPVFAEIVIGGPPTDLNEAQEKIAEEVNAIRDMLLEKNKAYGNSVLDPIRVFSQVDSIEQLKVRIDDKLSRLKRGAGSGAHTAFGEDVIFDLIGYLVLLRIALRS
jgi:hypothetical protein